MSKSKHPKSLYIAPLAISALFGILYLFQFWQNLEYGAYDLFLGMKPPVAIDESIVLLDIDDPSIEKIGSYPWPRGLLAQGLEALAELDAEYAIFDIEYLENSPKTVDSTYMEGPLASEFETSYGEIESNLSDVFQALAERRIPLSEAGSYGQALLEYMDSVWSNLIKKTSLVAIENDSYLGQAMRLFGSAYTTLNMQPDPASAVYAERMTLAKERFVYANAEKESEGIVIPSDTVSYLVPIPEISGASAGAGFTNVWIDADGVRRRIRLVDEVDGDLYLQLAMAPLAHKIGNPRITVGDRYISLEGATIVDEKSSIRIPLDDQGMMLIRWPREAYIDSFKHIPFHLLLDYRNDAEELASDLRRLKANQGWILGPGYAPIDACLDAWIMSEEARVLALDSGSAEDRSTWLIAREEYWQTVKAFLDQGYDVSVPALFDEARDADVPENATLYDELRDNFASLYQNVELEYAGHAELDAMLRPTLAGAFCIIGWTSTATTDIGVNPFHKEYVNVGTHAAVANTILQHDFLTEAPLWISSLLSVVLAALVLLLIGRMETKAQILVGMSATIAILAASYAVFHVTGVYIAIVSPVLATFASFLTYSLLSFLVSEREKSFLRKAFGTYLSGDVINQIVEDPTMLKLGGQKKWMSAMFTDIRGFSTVSEQLDAEQLVRLLNVYLSGMSDIILENRGTIDKYEGDAIISFFGAPVGYPDHAAKACRSALLMKRKEAELNERFIADGLAPTPLLTRIGLNTGDMVVGNMGTERKMDYTIMGNAVNLAARLEGVNKQYGSWILMTGDTRKEAGDEFVARRLDSVRVVGINTPVQLWELVDFKADVSDETVAFLGRFDEARDEFEGRDWKKAMSSFNALSRERPDDGPTKSYIKKCEVFLRKPPAADWDGVFALTEK